MLAVFVTFLCLASVGHSAPLACEKLVQSLDQLNLQNMVGSWAIIAGSQKDIVAVGAFKRRDSVTVDIYNSSYILASRYGDKCLYHRHNFSVEGHVIRMKQEDYNFTVTFFHTSCLDCLVLTLDTESSHYKSMDMYLLSKRRQLEQKEMEDFTAQVECLNMPPPIVKDPTKELCPKETASGPVAQLEEKPEGQKD